MNFLVDECFIEHYPEPFEKPGGGSLLGNFSSLMGS